MFTIWSILDFEVSEFNNEHQFPVQEHAKWIFVYVKKDWCFLSYLNLRFSRLLLFLSTQYIAYVYIRVYLQMIWLQKLRLLGKLYQELLFADEAGLCYFYRYFQFESLKSITYIFRGFLLAIFPQQIIHWIMSVQHRQNICSVLPKKSTSAPCSQ